MPAHLVARISASIAAEQAARGPGSSPLRPGAAPCGGTAGLAAAAAAVVGRRQARRCSPAPARATSAPPSRRRGPDRQRRRRQCRSDRPERLGGQRHARATGREPRAVHALAQASQPATAARPPAVHRRGLHEARPRRPRPRALLSIPASRWSRSPRSRRRVGPIATPSRAWLVPVGGRPAASRPRAGEVTADLGFYDGVPAAVHRRCPPEPATPPTPCSGCARLANPAVLPGPSPCRDRARSCREPRRVPGTIAALRSVADSRHRMLRCTAYSTTRGCIRVSTTHLPTSAV